MSILDEILAEQKKFQEERAKMLRKQLKKLPSKRLKEIKEHFLKNLNNQ